MKNGLFLMAAMVAGLLMTSEVNASGCGGYANNCGCNPCWCGPKGSYMNTQYGPGYNGRRGGAYANKQQGPIFGRRGSCCGCYGGCGSYGY